MGQVGQVPVLLKYFGDKTGKEYRKTGCSKTDMGHSKTDIGKSKTGFRCSRDRCGTVV